MPIINYIVLRKVHWFWKIDKWEYVGCFTKRQLKNRIIKSLYWQNLKIISVPFDKKMKK